MPISVPGDFAVDNDLLPILIRFGDRLTPTNIRIDVMQADWGLDACLRPDR
jgi:hypothetical protein